MNGDVNKAPGDWSDRFPSNSYTLAYCNEPELNYVWSETFINVHQCTWLKSNGCSISAMDFWSAALRAFPLSHYLGGPSN